MPHALLRTSAIVLTLAHSAPFAAAQRVAPVRLERGAPALDASASARPLAVTQPQGSGPRPRVMLTGYWPPSNEALRPFSENPAQNPAGWVGSDWRGRGYDVVSFFPEFAVPNCSNCGQGMGDFEVDYQDTSADFWSIVAQEQPIAIITFSRGAGNRSWEVEMNQFNRTSWIPDFTPPTGATPSPPDAGFAPNFKRLSALPVQGIIDAIALSGLNVTPFICFSGSGGGGYLSEYIAYHGVWYQHLHRDPLDPLWCIAAGHVHVGSQVDWPTARLAAEVTVERVLDHLDAVRACAPPPQTYCGITPNSAGAGTYLDARGVPSLAANSLSLVAHQGPPNTSSLLVFGSGRAMTPLGDGQLCIASALRRIGPLGNFDVRGARVIPVDLTLPNFAGVTSGSTWAFQLWHRDSIGLGVNLSDALEVTFCP